MGENKPQGVPAAVLMAQKVLADMAPELDEARVIELRKKLPAYALRLEKEGQSPTPEVLRAAALDLSAIFARASGGGAGGGQLSFADYPRIRQDLLIDRKNPWFSAFASQDVAVFEGLWAQGVYMPQSKEAWDVLLRSLAAGPNPLPIVDQLIARNTNPDFIDETAPHHLHMIMANRAEELRAYPRLLTYMQSNNNFWSRLGRNGMHDVAEKLLALPEFQGNERNYYHSMAIGAGHGGKADTFHYIGARMPEIYQHHRYVHPAACGGLTDVVDGFLDRLKGTAEYIPQVRHIIDLSLKMGCIEQVLALQGRGVPVADLWRNEQLLVNITVQGGIDSLRKVIESKLLPPEDIYPHIPAMLRQAQYNRSPDVVKYLQQLQVDAAVTIQAVENKANDDTDALTRWHIDSLRAAIRDNAPAAVVAHVAAELLGNYENQNRQTAYHDMPNPPQQGEISEALKIMRRVLQHRGGFPGLVGTIAREMNDEPTGKGRRLDRLCSVYSAVDEMIAAQSGTGSPLVEILQDLHRRSYRHVMQEHIVRMAQGTEAKFNDVREVFERIGVPDAETMARFIMALRENQRWLVLRQTIDAGYFDNVPERRDALLNDPACAVRLQQATSWERILPGRHIPANIMAQSPRHVRPALLDATMDLIRNQRQNYADTFVSAFKLCAVFRSEDRIMRFLERWGAGTPHVQYHLATLAENIPLPEKTAIDLAAWGDALLQYGPEMGRFVKYADRMAAPEGTLNEMREKIAQFHYPRGKESPKLAALCFKHNVSEKSFNRALELMEEQAVRPVPLARKIPDFAIDGADFGMEGARFYRLKDDDFRGLFLGYMVDCCQHLDGNAAWCAEHGFKSEEGGFYVIETKDGEIVGECWAWRGTGGQLVLDSLETLGKNKTENMRVSREQWSALIDRMRENLTAAPGDITALMVGTDGNRCPLLNYDVPNGPPVPYEKAKYAAVPRDHKGYADSKEQYLLWKTAEYKDEAIPVAAPPAPVAPQPVPVPVAPVPQPVADDPFAAQVMDDDGAPHPAPLRRQQDMHRMLFGWPNDLRRGGPPRREPF